MTEPLFTGFQFLPTLSPIYTHVIYAHNLITDTISPLQATLYFLRLRMRRKNQQASRARRWVERNSGSWAMKEVGPASQKKAEGETVS